MEKRITLTNERDIYPDDPQPVVVLSSRRPAKRTAKRSTSGLGKRYADGRGWSSAFPGNPNVNKSDPQEPVDVETVKDAERLHAEPSLIKPNPNWPVILSSRRGVQTFTEQQVLMGIGVDASDWPDVTIIEQDIPHAPALAGVNESTFGEADHSRTNVRASRLAKTANMAKGFGFGR